MAVRAHLYTVKELADMRDDRKLYELHNGILVEVLPGLKLPVSKIFERVK